jgi:hypothetical protein
MKIPERVELWTANSEVKAMKGSARYMKIGNFIGIEETDVVVEKKLFNLPASMIDVWTTPERIVTIHVTNDNERLRELAD